MRFLRELLSGKPDRRRVPDNADNADAPTPASAFGATTAGTSSPFDPDKSTHRATREAIGERDAHSDTSESVQRTSGATINRETSMSMSGELSPLKKLIPKARFRCLHFINRGANGFVVLAQDRHAGGGHSDDYQAGANRVEASSSGPIGSDGTPEERKYYALKFMELNWDARAAKYVEREIVNQFKLKHPHVIKLEEIFLTETHLALVLEYADGGDMFQYVKQRGHLDESHARWFFQQIILALDYCHRMGIVNRDIKLENVLLTSNQMLPSGMPLVKLSDFGFSKDEDVHSAPRTRLGTPMYIAPEVLRNRPGAFYDGRKCDIWGTGVVLHVMLTGQYPFLSAQFSSKDVDSTKGRQEMMSRILDQDYRRIPWLSDECNELLDGLLDFDPATRMSTTEVMKSAWFMKSLGPSVMDFNDKLIGRHRESPRVTEDTVQQVRTLLQHVASMTQRNAQGGNDREAMDEDE